MIKLVKKQQEINSQEINEMYTIHKELVADGWISNYYQNLEELNFKIIDELGKTKYLELAIQDRKVVGFIVFNIADSKITLIEVSLGNHGQGVGKKLVLFLQSEFNILLATIDSLKPDAINQLLLSVGFKNISLGSDKLGGSSWRWEKPKRVENRF
jgi:hypothetical protein